MSHDDEPQVFVLAIGHLIRKKGVAEVSRLTGLNRESLYKTVNGTTSPSWDTMQRLLKAININLSFNFSKPVFAS
nr:addiction module antidote protein [uncultured Moraxella sp.]